MLITLAEKREATLIDAKKRANLKIRALPFNVPKLIGGIAGCRFA